MKTRFLIVVLLSVFTSTLRSGLAQASAPMAALEVSDGSSYEFTDWNQNIDGTYSTNFSVESSGWKVSGGATALADPYISYGVAFQNFTNSDLSFVFVVYDPIVPITGPNQIYASFSGSGTDVLGDGFSFLPLGSEFGSHVQITGLNSFGDFLGLGIGQAYVDGPGFPGHSNDLGVFSAGPMPGPVPGPFTDLDLALGFNLGGHGDIATVNGFTSISVAPVPEPASAMLMGLGLLGMGVVARRRRNKQANPDPLV